MITNGYAERLCAGVGVGRNSKFGGNKSTFRHILAEIEAVKQVTTLGLKRVANSGIG